MFPMVDLDFARSDSGTTASTRLAKINVEYDRLWLFALFILLLHDLPRDDATR